MSALIKAGAVSSLVAPLRPFAQQSCDAMPPRSEEALLAARVAELESAIAARDEYLPAQLAEARDAGRAEALAERSEGEAKQLVAIDQALAAATDHWRQSLSQWESAAAGLAKAVLTKVFGDEQSRSNLVEAAIHRRIALLGETAVVRIRVNGDDFPPPCLERISHQATADATIIVDPSLGRGGCEFDLKLGHVDLSLGSQWERIATLLDQLEQQGQPA